MVHDTWNLFLTSAISDEVLRPITSVVATKNLDVDLKKCFIGMSFEYKFKTRHEIINLPGFYPSV